jgi:hypothetical protein
MRWMKKCGVYGVWDRAGKFNNGLVIFGLVIFGLVIFGRYGRRL